MKKLLQEKENIGKANGNPASVVNIEDNPAQRPIVHKS